jgi:hypothetical protein
VAFELWGHRLVRSSLGPICHLVLVGAAIRDRRARGARVFLLAHAAGLVATLRARRGGGMLVERLAAQLLFLQAVGLGGTIRFLRGDRPSRWEKEERRAFDDGAP